MDSFASGAVIFLLLCIVTLIVIIVFFPGTSTTNTTTTIKATNVPVTPGNDLDGADVNYPLSSNRGHYSNSNINTSTNLTFLNELYDILRNSNNGVTTVRGNTSNIYVNNLLSGASGVSTGNSSNAYWNNGGSAMVNPDGSYANFTHAQWAQMGGFSDYDLAGYSPY